MSGTLTFTFLEWGLCLWGGAFSHILYLPGFSECELSWSLPSFITSQC